MENIIFFWINGSENTVDKKDCFAIREAVFVKEQGFQKALEFDGIDSYAEHLLIRVNGVSAGAARLFREGTVWHLGRICVLPQFRKLGLGSRILTIACQKAKEQGAVRLLLGAQLRAKEFYIKNGFTAISGVAPYDDEGVPHIEMSREL